MTYNYYLECSGKYIKNVKHYIQGYKTIRGLEKARKTFLESQKLVETGRVLFAYCGASGINGAEYKRENYTILEQFNAKVFFEFWG